METPKTTHTHTHKHACKQLTHLKMAVNSVPATVIKWPVSVPDTICHAKKKKQKNKKTKKTSM